LAADFADDAPRALMMAPPRVATVLMKSPFNHAQSLTAMRTGVFLIQAWFTSGSVQS
jgi:hypothetical protein